MDEITARRLLGNLIGAAENNGIGAASNAMPAFAKIDESVIRHLNSARNGGGLGELVGGTRSAASNANKVSNGIFADASIISGARSASQNEDPGAGADAESESELSESEIDQIVIAAWRAGRVDGTRINYDLREPWEQLWALYPSGDFHYAGRIRSGRSVNVPRGRIAVLHSHPKWAKFKPGREDRGFGVPLYGLARSGVWVIYPGGGGATVLAGQGSL